MADYCSYVVETTLPPANADGGPAVFAVAVDYNPFAIKESHDRLEAACQAMVAESERRTRIQGGRDTMALNVIPQVEAALDAVPKREEAGE